MTHGKCVYCESPLEVSGWLEIEHHAAKSSAPFVEDTAFEWSNLFPACSLCNNAKGPKQHRGAIFKPDVEDPEPRFWFNPATAELEPADQEGDPLRARAETTIELCNLKRGGLSAARRRVYLAVRTALAARDEEALDECLRSDYPHKHVVRSVLRDCGRPDLCEQDRKRFLGR